MNDLNIEKFSPQRAELTKLADKYSSLEITGIDDVTGYAMVDVARKDLKTKRVAIKHTGKELRQEAIDFQKGVITLEKELIAIIEPLEQELKAKQDKVKEEKVKIGRQAVLPERKEKLEKIGVEVANDELLLMSPEIFQEFYNEKNSEYLEEEKRKLEEEKAKIAREKELEEAAKKARIEAEKQAKKDAVRKAKEVKEREEQLEKDAKEREKNIKLLALEREARLKDDAERDRQKLIDDQKKREQDGLDAKQAEEDEAARVAKKQEEERAKMEKKKQYVQFLGDNGYTDANQAEFHKEVTETEVILYKRIATFNFKK